MSQAQSQRPFIKVISSAVLAMKNTKSSVLEKLHNLCQKHIKNTKNCVSDTFEKCRHPLDPTSLKLFALPLH